MKHIWKKNQVIITALAIMIAVAGYLNFTNDTIKPNVQANIQKTAQLAKEEQDTLLDLSEADLKTKAETEQKEFEVADTGEIKKASSQETKGEAVLANSSSTGANFFASAKLTREQTRDKNKELLMDIINNTNVTEEEKKNAIQSMIEMTEISEKESATETLLSAKGFEGAVVSIVDGSVDVVINEKELTDQKIAQIEDIVKRKTGIRADKIVITPVEEKEK